MQRHWVCRAVALARVEVSAEQAVQRVLPWVEE